MAEGILRARYRDSLSLPSPLTPGQVYRLEIDLVGTSELVVTDVRSTQATLACRTFPASTAGGRRIELA